MPRDVASWRVAELCRQAGSMLAALGLGRGFTLAQLRDRVEQRRGRPLHLIPRDVPALAPHGLWVAGGHGDYVFYDRAAGPVRQHQIILALAAFSLPITIDPFDPRLDRAVGVLDVGRVSGAGLTMVAAGAAQSVLLCLLDTDDEVCRRVRRRNRAMVCCVALLVALFALTPARYRLTDPYVHGGTYYQATPTLAAAPYLLIYLGYVAWAALQGAVLSLRYARSATQVLLRLGLRLAAAGSVLGVGYLSVKVVATIDATGAHRAAEPGRPADRAAVHRYDGAAARGRDPPVLGRPDRPGPRLRQPDGPA